MHPKTMKRTKTWVLEPMGWIGCVHCHKFWHDFVARNFALIVPVQYVLHHVSCSYEIIRNELKHCAMHKNMSLGSNGVDRVRSLRKITTWLHGTNFCINCTSSPCFALSFLQLRNDAKCTQHYETHQNMSLGFNWVDRVRLFWKILARLHGTNLCINSTISARFASTFVQ